MTNFGQIDVGDCQVIGFFERAVEVAEETGWTLKLELEICISHTLNISGTAIRWLVGHAVDLVSNLQADQDVETF